MGIAITTLVLTLGLTLTACDNGFFSQGPDGQDQAPGKLTEDTPSKPSDRVFRVDRDGFHFRNYTRNALGLTPRMVERLCGPEACARGSGDDCVLSAAMESFMLVENHKMMRGHCEGMNVLAQAILVGYTDIRSINRDAENTFQLPFGPRVQERIAFWYATQHTRPGGDTFMQSPNEVLEALESNPNEYSIGVCRRKHGKATCHSLTPIKILKSQEDPDKKLVHVYDSNYPKNNNRFIAVDIREDRFQYGPYEGQGPSTKFFIRSFANRIVSQLCPAKGLENNSKQSTGTWLATADGPVRVIPPKGAKERQNTDAPPTYLIEPKKASILILRGEKENNKEAVSVTIFSTGLAKTVEGIVLDPKEEDEIRLGEDDDTIVYKSKDGESLVVRYAATYKGADYIVEIAPSAESGFELFVENRADNRKGEHQLDVKIKSKDSKNIKFKVEMKRIGSTKDANFKHKKIVTLASGETATFEYGKWTKNKQPLTVLRDIDSDGYTDRTSFLSDDD